MPTRWPTDVLKALDAHHVRADECAAMRTFRVPATGALLRGVPAGDSSYYPVLEYNMVSNAAVPLPAGAVGERPTERYKRTFLCGDRKLVVRVDAAYRTHFNGGRPYRVLVSANNRVRVYSLPDANQWHIARGLYDDDEHNIGMYNTKQLDLRAERVWVGRARTGEPHTGNSILLHCEGKRYVFVGDAVFSFVAPDPIETFVSDMGNSDVPYPYAIDRAGRHYLLTESAVLERVPPSEEEDVYAFYYRTVGMSAFGAGGLPSAPTGNGIDAILLDGDEYQLDWKPRAKDEYRRLTTQWPSRPPRLRMLDGSVRSLSESDFVALLSEHAQQHGLRALRTATIHHP